MNFLYCRDQSALIFAGAGPELMAAYRDAGLGRLAMSLAPAAALFACDTGPVGGAQGASSSAMRQRSPYAAWLAAASRPIDGRSGCGDDSRV